MSDIFISYKREEQAVARKLANALESEGWSVWWDPKLRAGEHFDDVIEKALNEAKCVIVMWSNLSVNSEYIKAEATEALEQKKLVPVKIENVNLPFRFKRVQTPSLLNWDGSRDSPDFRKFVGDISAILSDSSKIIPDHTKQAEEERLREQERQRSEEEAKRKAEEENQRRIEEERNRARQEAERRRLEAEARRREEKRLRVVAAVVVVLVVFSVVFWWPKRQETERADKLGPPKEIEIVVIQVGSFQMGDVQGGGVEAEIPVHTVRIHTPFAIGRYEVTFDEYDQFATVKKRKLPNDGGWGRGRRPVTVSWKDAVEYAKWLSEQTGKRYRLPTEAEWEYAARGGTETAYWWGNEMKSGMANCAACGSQWDDKNAPVGSFKPNPFGLDDTAGNVGEWVDDCWHDNYNGAPADGSAWKETSGGNCGQRVIRGGSSRDLPKALRASSRFRANADDRHGNTGFRLAQDLD
jgi:formylglycine-generating enzyme required for sulfatase activity